MISNITLNNFFPESDVSQSGSAAYPDVPNYVKDYPAESEHSYILFVQSAYSLPEFVELENISNEQEWNPKDNFLILVAVMSYCFDVEESYNISETLWRTSRILNAVTYVKYFTECIGNEDTVFIYNPFHTNENWNTRGKITTIDLGRVSQIPKTYLQKTWNLGQYCLQVSLFNIFPTAVRDCGNCTFSHTPEYNHYNCNCTYKGRDWLVLKNLATFMNFIPYIVPESYSTDVSQSIFDLTSRSSEIAFNERYMKFYGNNLVEFTMPAFYTRRIVVIVPKARIIPIWTVIWQYFSGYFWIYFIFAFVASTISWYMLRRPNENVSQFSTAFDMLAVFITMSLNIITRVVSSSQRILLMCCLFSSLIIMCCFQSSLLEVVTHPHFYPEINTLTQLDEANLPIITLDSSLVDTFNESDSMINLVHKVQYIKP
ncbi:hypothetical protein L9F63_009452 [Diploptera punctata]|uniref:Uncharacterized protein n=1 Tax=Diploptera punctata TaxID=6984 RepID=A0AAD8AJM5_DIPPU|nr:hypothetical protein L9F63_009452 [Diploptera punctata]